MLMITEDILVRDIMGQICVTAVYGGGRSVGAVNAVIVPSLRYVWDTIHSNSYFQLQ